MSAKGIKNKQYHQSRYQEASTCASGMLISKNQSIARLKASLNDYLGKKYAISTHLYFKKPVEAILTQARHPESIQYAYDCDFEEKQELLRRIYRLRESADKIYQLTEYFKYHYEIPRIFMSEFLDHVDYFHDRRRNLIYQQVKEMIGQDNIVGDESMEKYENHQKKDQQVYPAILQSFKHSRYEKTDSPVKGANESLKELLQEIGSVNQTVSELDMTTRDVFKNSQRDFMKFMESKEPEEPKKKVIVLPSKKADFKPLKNNFNTLPAKLTKQNHPTVLQKKVSIKEIQKSGLGQFSGMAIMEPKRSPREIMTSNRSRVSDFKMNLPLEQKQQLTVNNFRKEIEEFHKIQASNYRKNELFMSLKESKNMTKPLSISPRIESKSSTRAGFESMKIMKTEPSYPFASSRKSVSGTKAIDHKPKSSSKLSLGGPISAKIAGMKQTHKTHNSNSKTQTLKRYPTSKEKEFSTRKPILNMKNRMSFQNIASSTSPRDLIMRRLKSEEKEDHKQNFDRYGDWDIKSSYNRFTLVGKSPKSRIQALPERFKESSKLKKVSSPSKKVLQSTRSRVKLNSVHLT